MTADRGDGDVARYLQRADLLDDLGRYDEAAQELREALRLRPDHPEPLAMLGLIELRAGRTEAALEPVDAALAIDPGHLLAQVVRGHTLAELGRTEDALDAADLLLARDPGSWYNQLHFAAIVRRVRNGQAALDAAWRAVELAPEQPETHLVLGAVAAGLGLTELAERAYGKARQLDPDAATSGGDYGMAVIRDVPRTASPSPAAGGAGNSELGGFAVVLQGGAVYAWAAPLLVALMLVAGDGASRLTAGVAGVIGLVLIGGLAVRAANRRSDPGPLAGSLAARIAAVVAAPAFLLVYAVTGWLWPLVVVVAIGAFAITAVALRYDGHHPA